MFKAREESSEHTSEAPWVLVYNLRVDGGPLKDHTVCCIHTTLCVGVTEKHWKTIT